MTNLENGTTNGVVQNNTAPTTQKQNNNNKGESGVSSRRGKSNSESKAQAARNKHKNSQNKEKHGNARTTSRSESNSNIATQPQVNGQKEIANPAGSDSSATTTTTTSTTTATATVAATTTATSSEVPVQKSSGGGRLKAEQPPQPQQQTVQNNKTAKLVQQVQDLKINGIVQNGDQSHSENDVTENQREGGTPASTVSSSEDSSTNHPVERLADSSEETNSTAILGEFTRIIVVLLAILVYCRWISYFKF